MTHEHNDATQLKSGIYIGQVRHRRFSPKSHRFIYKLYMLALDLDETEQLNNISPWLAVCCTGSKGKKALAPLNVNLDDYLAENVNANSQVEQTTSLKQRVTNKVHDLGHTGSVDRVLMVCQVRCLGLYFSPINLFYCYQGDDCVCLLAEVSNTPWNQRHYYLVDMKQGQNAKNFHVSPFMAMDMNYLWRLRKPAKRLLVHIENHQNQASKEKVFDATLTLTKQPITAKTVPSLLRQFPSMTLTIVCAIYWQALKLFIKRVPFVAHPNT